MWYNKFFSQMDIDNIEAAITKAESKTSGEIVPVVVRRSSAIGHVPLLLTLLFMFVLTFIVAFSWPEAFHAPYSYFWPLVWAFIFMVSLGMAFSKGIQRFFVPNHDEEWQVFQRAKLEFYENKVYRTEDGTGILLFVSVMERKAIILADEGISKKLPPETWEKILKPFRASLSKGQWGEAFVKAIEECGELLAPHFPIQSGDQNQIQNHLIIKE